MARSALAQVLMAMVCCVARSIKLLVILASEAGLAKVTSEFPDVEVSEC